MSDKLNSKLNNITKSLNSSHKRLSRLDDQVKGQDDINEKQDRFNTETVDRSIDQDSINKEMFKTIEALDSLLHGVNDRIDLRNIKQNELNKANGDALKKMSALNTIKHNELDEALSQLERVVNVDIPNLKENFESLSDNAFGYSELSKRIKKLEEVYDLNNISYMINQDANLDKAMLNRIDSLEKIVFKREAEAVKKNSHPPVRVTLKDHLISDFGFKFVNCHNKLDSKYLEYTYSRIKPLWNNEKCRLVELLHSFGACYQILEEHKLKNVLKFSRSKESVRAEKELPKAKPEPLTINVSSLKGMLKDYNIIHNTCCNKIIKEYVESDLKNSMSIHDALYQKKIEANNQMYREELTEDALKILDFDLKDTCFKSFGGNWYNDSTKKSYRIDPNISVEEYNSLVKVIKTKFGSLLTFGAYTLASESGDKDDILGFTGVDMPFSFDTPVSDMILKSYPKVYSKTCEHPSRCMSVKPFDNGCIGCNAYKKRKPKKVLKELGFEMISVKPEKYGTNRVLNTGYTFEKKGKISEEERKFIRKAYPEHLIEAQYTEYIGKTIVHYDRCKDSNMLALLKAYGRAGLHTDIKGVLAIGYDTNVVSFKFPTDIPVHEILSAKELLDVELCKTPLDITVYKAGDYDYTYTIN